MFPRLVFFILSCAFGISCLVSAPAFAGKTAIIVMVSTSGVEDGSLEGEKTAMFGRVAQLGKMRQFKNADLIVGDLSTGQVIWTGTPKSLSKGKRTKGLAEGIKRNPGRCSNLMAGFRAIENQIRQKKILGYDTFHIFIFGGLIDTGSSAQCRQNVSLRLPQQPNPKLNFGKIFHQPEIKSLVMLGVHDWQIAGWSEFAEPTMQEFADRGAIFKIHGVAETRHLLANGKFTWMMGPDRRAFGGSVHLVSSKFSATMPGLSERFSLITPSQESGFGDFDFSFNHALRNASISDMRIDAKGLTLKDGTPIQDYAFEKDVGVVVAVGPPLTHVSITSIEAGANNDLEILALFSKNHEHMSPDQSQVAAFDLATFERLDWSMSPITSRDEKQLAVWVIADVSVSMENVIDTLQSSAKEFLENMEPGVSCSLITFDNEIHRLSPQPEDCKQAAGRVGGIVTNGNGTNLWGTLQKLYTHAAQAGYSHNLFIVLSDGEDYSGLSKQIAIDAKAKVNGQTLVMWMGDYSKEDLDGLADIEMTTGSDVQGGLAGLFGDLKTYVAGQSLIRVKRSSTLSMNQN